MRTFQNYHRHSMYTNVRISDSAVTPEQYAERAKGLGHGILSSCEHGWQGNYYETIKCAKKYGLKPLIGAEAYWVADRSAKDRTNCHIFIGAKNENGRQALNDILSEANLTGFYGQPRIDIPLILSLPPDDVIITTACVAYWRYDNIEEITETFARHFDKNFFLEVQYHNTESQRELNKRILRLHNHLKIPLIMGCDSHYITPSQAKIRSDFLVSKGLTYPDEEGWYLDYPDGDTAYQRFADQCILSHSEICDAMDNTNVFLDVEEYDTPIFNSEIKMPSLYPNASQEEKNEKYKRLVWQGWDNYKNQVPEELWPHYEEEIKKEVQTVVDTNMADYFIDNYYIIKKGKENGGWLTKSGRGCFTGDSMVPTLDGFKRLDEVEIGDSVLDKNGEFQKVVDTFEYEINEPMVKIDYAYMSDSFSPMICTEDHMILTKSAECGTAWKQAKDLREGDYLCTPKAHFSAILDEQIDLNNFNVFGYEFDENYIYEKNPHRLNEYRFSPSDVARHIGCGKSVIENIANRKTKEGKRNKKIVSDLLDYTGFGSIDEYVSYVERVRTIKINRFIPNDFFMNVWIGLMYGDGFAPNNKTVVGLAVNTNTYKNRINKAVFELIASRVGLSPKERISTSKALTQITVSGNIFSRFVHEILFESKKGTCKKFNPGLFYQTRKNLEGIILGLKLSDGSYCDKDRISFDNTSLSIVSAFQIINLATRANPLSISVRKTWEDPRGYKCKTSYKVRSYEKNSVHMKKMYRVLSDEDYIYLPVWKISPLPPATRKVYDLTVENSHSYVINNVVVHNSAVSYLTNMLLGFTEVDRVAAKVHMYPERFMSTTRILQSGSLPDIDFNCAPVEPFARAQKEVLGEDHSYPMVAYGTMQKSAAWKLYAKSQGIPFEIANKVSEQIRKYEAALKHAAEDEKDAIEVLDYIDKEFHEIYATSRDYLGLVTSWSIAPCSYLLYSGSIRKEIGLVKVKDHLCCIMDGHWAEECHFLKNDLLKVSVVDLIYRAYHRIGMDPPTVNELLKMCPPDDPAWSIYEKGCTLGINQCEQPGTSARVAKYKPHNISELGAFVAAIRPGFKSMYKTFESRQPFKYGVKSFDDLIQTEEMPNSFLLYQEQEMAALNYAGIDMSDCYTAIKNIAKKRVDKVLSYKETFIEGFSKSLIEDEHKSPAEAAELSDKLWKIIEDSASYSFNASHSYCVALDSLYGAWLKAHHPLEFYEVLLTISEKKGDKDKMNALKEEAESYFGISFPPFRFGQDNRSIRAIPEQNAIVNSLSAIKGFGSNVSKVLYDCSKTGFVSFVDVLAWLDYYGVKAAKVRPLILIDYFAEFGNITELTAILDAWEFTRQGEAKQIKKDSEIPQILRLILEEEYSPKGATGAELASYRLDGNGILLMKRYEGLVKKAKLAPPSIREQIQNCVDILGYCDVVTGRPEDRKRLLITESVPLIGRDSKPWAYRIGTRSVGTGKQARLTVRTNVMEKKKLSPGDIIHAAQLFKNAAGYWYLLSYDKES